MIRRRGWSGIRCGSGLADADDLYRQPGSDRSDLQERLKLFGLSYLVVGEDGMNALTKIAGAM
jgi:hypothetical protein